MRARSRKCSHDMSMMRHLCLPTILLWMVLLSAHGCVGRRLAQDPKQNGPTSVPEPPMAERRPHKIVTEGEGRKEVIEDPYYWLRDDDRKDPDVLKYLEAENEYVEAAMADTEKLQEKLFEEMRDRQPKADQSVPDRHGDYFNYTKTVEGEQYKVHCRRKVPEGMGAPTELDEMDESIPEEVLLDENAEAGSHKFFEMHGFSISPNNKLMIYSVDNTGSENFTMHIKEIETGRELLDEPIVTSGTMIFADDETVFYATRNKQSIPDKLWRHRIGTSPKEDELVYAEKDSNVFNLVPLRSRDGKFLFLITRATPAIKTRFLDTQNLEGDWEMLYEADNQDIIAEHRNGHFYTLVRDDERPNGEIFVAPVSDLESQKVLIPSRDNAQILSFTLAKNFLTVFGMKNATRTVTVYELPKNGSPPEVLGEGRELEFDEATFIVEPGVQGDFDSDILRLSYNSFTTPRTTIDYNMATGNRSVKKVTPVLGGFNSSDYENLRLWATADDSTKIPISLVFRKDAVKLDGTAPMWFGAFGAYGMMYDPTFSLRRLSLLDRGFIYVIAHARGGGELGREWWEAGRLLNKNTTLTDIIACAEYLISQNYSSPEKMIAYGSGGGGATMGAVVNIRPDLFHAAVMDMAWVDVLVSLLDETVPATLSDRDDFGDPNDWEYYDLIKTYSPVDNIRAQDYPHILATNGLNNWRVPYWEVAKYIAKLRYLKTDDNLIVMRTDMQAGHSIRAGRFDRFEESAWMYAFLLKSLGVTDASLENND